MTVSNDKIIPIGDMDYEDNQKLVIFNDYACSVIYLSQSFYKHQET